MERVGNFRMFDSWQQEVETSEELENFPAVPLPLIDALEQLFPNRIPMDYCTDWEMGRKVGQQQVIHLLRQVAGQRT